MKHKSIFSLRYKQIFVLILGTAISLFMCFLVQTFGNLAIEKKYLNETAEMKRLVTYQKSLQNYINKKHISIKNVRDISKWVKSQQYVYLIIYDDDEIIYESGYWDDKYSAYEFTQAADESSTSDGENIEDEIGRITFSDGTYYVSIMDSSELRWYDIVTYGSLGVFFLFLFSILILYNRRIIARIMQLSKEVSLIEKGDLEQPIFHKGNDEISLLAENADNMRSSIIARHKSEKEAWEANSELITSMSHDIRTPLTSIIGYLEILDSKNYRSEEQFDKYIKSCKAKSIQLKDLSDKLFQYFLVFGKEKILMQMESFDVRILFQQLISEHVFDLSNLGFNVSQTFEEQPCTITADIQYLKRLFDNLFSNVTKYADTSGQIIVAGYIEGNNLVISILNDIRKDSAILESTNIGLKTCQKIVEQMNGTFEIKKDHSHFEVRTVFPVKRIREE
ncbi:HAMP domain-containing sensor histidine kinase [Anaerocolumna xylanovorans]|uniref:histidine kinase n=1 Tax=Anaerocolumna xylanovorans DSM 12503 TaxID=1121345 RepID=A0A1M7Y712_9FIRM|nr:HAMP domain-containing sensor histidine kinase [Anaerocolumna xylanovorans]SHO48381.1 Signal transduction histidine kinase [Anaerocolumna xylanovorans DSM 12503]